MQRMRPKGLAVTVNRKEHEVSNSDEHEGVCSHVQHSRHVQKARKASHSWRCRQCWWLPGRRRWTVAGRCPLGWVTHHSRSPLAPPDRHSRRPPAAPAPAPARQTPAAAPGLASPCRQGGPNKLRTETALLSKPVCICAYTSHHSVSVAGAWVGELSASAM